MCNPRRLEVNLVEEIEEEWQATVQQSATARTEVSERLERVIPLAPQGSTLGRLGPSAILNLGEALEAGFRGWQPVPGQEGFFTRDLGALRLTLDLATANLLITAERSSAVTGSAEASEDYAATIRQRLEIQEQGSYYDDGYGGRTEEAVRPQVEERAQARLADEKGRVIEEQTRQARQAATLRAAEEAKRRAEEVAQNLGEEERRLLREELDALFAQSSGLLREELGALVGEILRRSILHLVRVNGGELRRSEETEDEIVLEVQL